MIRTRTGLALTTGLVIFGSTVLMIAQGRDDWKEFGGPHRNFTADARGLAKSWREGGPPRLWSRTLGEGHSSVLVENGRLYTIYRPLGLLSLIRRSQEEVITALNASNGATIWEFRYPSPPEGFDFSRGAGPHSTPLIVGDRLFATSTRRELRALDKRTGKALWTRDFVEDYGGPEHFAAVLGDVDRGYACSPIAYNDTVIVTLGGAGQGVAAFKQETGDLVWKSGDFRFSPASPILIDVDGQPQLIVFGGDQVVGMDPANGRTLWSHAHPTTGGWNISTPVWSKEANQLFISSAYGMGSRVLGLRQRDGQTSVIEKWFSPRMRVHISNVVRIGDYLYGSSDPGYFTAVNAHTGDVAWRSREFARAQAIYADEKIFILDEDGTLAVALVSPKEMTVLARAVVMDTYSWTPPTLAGTTLYVRDRKSLVAFDLRE